jgi:hypothetical protein
MSLQAVIDSVAGALRDGTGVDQVLTDPPSRLPDDRCFLVYAQPGLTSFMANKGRLGNVAYEAEDDIFIDFHIRSARDAMTEVEPKARVMLELFRDTIISAMQRNRLESVHAFRGLSFPVYGPLEYWNGDTSFGFQAVLSITHCTVVSSGASS